MKLCAALVIVSASLLQAGPVSELSLRGYQILPLPQKVDLRPGDIAIAGDWTIARRASVSADSVAVEELSDALHLKAAKGQERGRQIVLETRPGSVEIGAAQDQNRSALAEQAYQIELTPGRIAITANTDAGLLYGAYTLIQLATPRAGGLQVPEGVIVDWPDLELRHMYWDDAHHLETLSEFKRIIRKAAFFKMNGLTVKLEGHYQFSSAPALVEPYALTPAEVRELTNYARRYHVEWVPYLDGPAHIAFILKHPEYAKLRAFPDSNYELCATNPASYQLMEGMFRDLLAGNEGGRFFYLSTDEPYYIGKAANAQCNEASRMQELGSPGKLLSEFVQKTAGYLQKQGRTVIFWGEPPLKPEDISSLPKGLINGEVVSPEYDRAFRAHGIRQMIYTSSEGEERLFPNYFILPASRWLHRERLPEPRISEIFEKISFDSSRKNSTLIGSVNAGWADMGVHPETFWLGYAASAATAWRPGAQQPFETMAAFFRQYYGPGASSLPRAYQLLSEQAEFWMDSWDTGDSNARKPIWGNSQGQFQPPHPANDQSIPLPSTDLSQASTWAKENARRLSLAQEAKRDNDELLGALYQSMQQATRNQDALEVFVAVANLCRENLDFLGTLGRMNSELESARAALNKRDSRAAVAALDQALDVAEAARVRRNQALHDAEKVWYQTWRPRTVEANGRRFLHEMDDVKDHLPDRTVDMTYLIYRELMLPMNEWANSVRVARNRIAGEAGQAARNDSFDWKAIQ